MFGTNQKKILNVNCKTITNIESLNTKTIIFDENHNLITNNILLDQHVLCVNERPTNTENTVKSKYCATTFVNNTNINENTAITHTTYDREISTNLLTTAQHTTEQKTYPITQKRPINTDTLFLKMPATSKYVFVQQNGNGRYTAVESPHAVSGRGITVNTTTTTANNNGVGNILLLATKPAENNDETHSSVVSKLNMVTNVAAVGSGDNDEDLCSLTWLNDSNLIKDINAKRNFTGNINNNFCVINASNAHDLIEELPHHVAGEEHVATTISSNSSGSHIELPADTQIGSVSVSEFQQQFIDENVKRTSHKFTTSNAMEITAVTCEPVPSQIYNNTSPAPIGATTTVHVGPSGTTTVVEYKSNSNYVLTPRQPNSSGSNAINIGNTVNFSSGNNQFVPSTLALANVKNNGDSTKSTPTISTMLTTTPTKLKQLSLSSTTVSSTSVTNNNNANINNVIGDTISITNSTIKHVQQQKNLFNVNRSIGTTTHHPHKKYLREKMNVLADQASPAPSCSSSSSSSSSPSSISSSTGAINGGNSPNSKNIYYPINNITISTDTETTDLTSQYSPSNGTRVPMTVFVTTPTKLSSLSTQNTTISQVTDAILTPDMSPPDLQNNTIVTQLVQQQPQRTLRSPTSYSSYDNDSLKDFEITTQNSQNALVVRGCDRLPSSQVQIPKSSNNMAAASNVVGSQKQKHPNNVPYDPLIHTNNKPPYSFSSLIFMAIEGSTEKALPVKEIYAWIVQHFPYFKTAPTGWKNSVRHNLSLNKSFVKVEKAPNMGKGSLWRVEQQQRPNLIQALTRSPLFPNAAIEKTTHKNANSLNNGDANYDTVDCANITINNNTIDHRFDPRYFPKLSKVFKDMTENGGLSDIIDDELVPSDYSTTNYCSNIVNISNKNNKNNNSKTYTDGSGMINTRNYEGSSIMLDVISIERLARDCGADNIDDVNAAAAMLALKHGPKVFSESFHNGSPIITSSPSEDHTYSAGGSGASTPHAGSNNNNNLQTVIVDTANTSGSIRDGSSDIQSNCASSDAAYESSEENYAHNNSSQKELDDQQRHRDGVDALLSLSTSCTPPMKRPASLNSEDEYLSVCNKQMQHHLLEGKLTLTNGMVSSNPAYVTSQSGSTTTHDEGYNTQYYYGSSPVNANQNRTNLLQSQQLSLQHSTTTSATPSKRPKMCRNLRPKFKRKATWTR